MTNSSHSRVIVGYDETPAAAAALAFAAHECRLRTGSLTVIHQLEGTEVPDYRCSARKQAEQLRRVEQSVRDAVMPLTRGLDVDVRAIERHVASSLVEASAAATLVVLGSDMRHAVLSAALDSVARAVVDDASCPVTLVPASEDAVYPVRRIVCGVNRSAASQNALAWGASEAALREVPLHVVEVAGPAAAAEPPLGEWVTEQLHEPTCDVTWSSATGATARVLLDTTARNGLLVIGHHEPHGRHWHRSVARALIAQTQTPVAVVPIGTAHARSAA